MRIFKYLFLGASILASSVCNTVSSISTTISTTISSTVSLSSNNKTPIQTPNFLSIGDWGSASIGGQHLKNVQIVSKQMKNYSDNYNSQFVLNTGDNFYYCGIQDLNDYQVKTDFTSLFNNLNIPWYNTLGNHDYGYNVSAQLDIPSINKNWIMDDRYYIRKIKITDAIQVYAIFIDTNPCVYDYIQNDTNYWDPCGSEYPTCSLHNTDDDFEGVCRFHENILSQNCYEQYKWFSKNIKELYAEKDLSISFNISTWIVVIGHHPVYEITEAPFYELVDLYADLYINGHEHLLNHYEINGKQKYITTGAGGMVAITNTNLLEGIKPIPTLRHTLEFQIPYTILWTDKVAGFTIHEFINGGKNLTTQFIKYDGSVIYEMTL